MLKKIEILNMMEFINPVSYLLIPQKRNILREYMMKSSYMINTTLLKFAANSPVTR